MLWTDNKINEKKWKACLAQMVLSSPAETHMKILHAFTYSYFVWFKMLEQSMNQVLTLLGTYLLIVAWLLFFFSSLKSSSKNPVVLLDWVYTKLGCFINLLCTPQS